MGKAYLGGDFLLIVVVLEAYSFESIMSSINEYKSSKFKGSISV